MNWRRCGHRGAGAWLLVMLAVSGWAAPGLVNYQGRLSDAEGRPLTAAGVEITFRFYAGAAAGGPLWEETQTVDVDGGVFSTLLGVTHPLDPSVFADSGVWLEMVVNGEVLSPRLPVTSVAYALRAATVEHDQDTLARLSCEPGQLPAWDGAAWGCVDAGTATLSEAEVEAFVTNGALDLAAGTTLGGQSISTGEHTTTLPWDAITAVPGGFADGVDDDALGALGCVSGEVAKWNGSSWACASDATGAGGVEDDPQVGANALNYTPKWNGTALVTGALYDNGRIGLGTNAPAEQLEIAAPSGGRAIVSDGGGADRNVILFQAPTASTNRGRILAHRYGTDYRGLDLVLQDSGGNVGIGMAPSERLEVAGTAQVTSGSPILAFKDTDGGGTRPLIRFLNNYGNFDSDDRSDEYFGFYSRFSSTRNYDAILRIFGDASSSWGNYLELTHDGADGAIRTDHGSLSIEPAGRMVSRIEDGMPRLTWVQEIAVKGDLRLVNQPGYLNPISSIRFGDDTVQSTAAVACWDLNGNGVPDVATEDVDSNGLVDVNDCRGPQGPIGPRGLQGLQGIQGLRGEPGEAGPDGIACWDTDMDRQNDPAEDINGDGRWDTSDCKDGIAGFHCWDTDMDRRNDPEEDTNADGQFTVDDCVRTVPTFCVGLHDVTNTSCDCVHELHKRVVGYGEGCEVTDSLGTQCKGYTTDLVKYGVCCVCW